MFSTTVLTYGTFDLFHMGHLNLLRRARTLGDRLLVGISNDEFNEVKGKRCVAPYAERAAIVAALKFVDGVFEEKTWDQKADDIMKYEATTLVMGDDWQGKFDHYSTLCQVLYLSRTPGISSSSRKIEIAEFQA